MKKLLSIAILAVMSAGSAYAGGSFANELVGSDGFGGLNFRDNLLGDLFPGAAQPVAPRIEMVPRAYPASQCEATALAGIEAISLGAAKETYSPHIIKAVVAIAAIGNSCSSPDVRIAAVRGVSAWITPGAYETTASAAAAAARLCGSDKGCAVVALGTMAPGMKANYKRTIISVIASIVNIVRLAPYEEVKTAAISILALGMQSEPAEVSDAIAEVAGCKTGK